MDFKLLRMEAGLSIDECAVLIGVSRRTVFKWENNEVQPPRAVFLCLSWRNGGLDAISPEWANFRVFGDCILSDEGDFVYPHEIRAIRYLFTASGIPRYRLAMKHMDTIELVSPSSSIPKDGLLVDGIAKAKLNNYVLSENDLNQAFHD